MRFLTRVQGHLFLVIEDNLESAKKAVKEQFDVDDLFDLSEMDADFIIQVELFDGGQFGYSKINGGH